MVLEDLPVVLGSELLSVGAPSAVRCKKRRCSSAVKKTRPAVEAPSTNMSRATALDGKDDGQCDREEAAW